MAYTKTFLFCTVLGLLTSIHTKAQVYPLSDPNNTGNWVLNGDFSDEFEGDSINRSRWHLQGEFSPDCEGDGCRDGIYYNGFKGRWPAQFRPENTWMENGKLILETRWEPDFDFADECDRRGTQYCYGKDLDGNPLPVTTAGVNSLKQFTYGYMEILSKAADAEITSSFWTIGSGAEIDMFEMFGKYENESRKHKEKELKFNLIEWADGFEPRFDTFIPTDWRVADDFYVYGFEWDSASVSVYIDGKFIQRFTVSDFNKGSGDEWTFTGSQRLWVDQESFPWNGLPNEEDLPAQYQIEYIRIWQKADQIEDKTSPLLNSLDTTNALTGGAVQVGLSEQAQLYIVPKGIAKDAAIIKTADKTPTVANEGTATVSTQGLSAGDYKIYAIDWAGNVSDATSAFSVESAPLSVNKLISSLNITPNPAAEYINIKGLSERLKSVTLIHTSGKRFDLDLIDNETVDISSLTEGIYVLLVSGYRPIKIIKQ